MNNDIKIPDVQLHIPPFPNWKRGVIYGFIAGGIIFILSFAYTIFLSTLPAISPVSLSVALRPWWKLNNWIISLIFVSPFFLFFGAKGAFTVKHKKRRT
jgi:hypothetical protein